MGKSTQPRVDPEPTPEGANETTFFVSGTLEVEKDKNVTVVARTGKETLIELNERAKLGNALTIGTWLNNTWATPVEVLLVNKPDPNNGNKVASQADIKQPAVKAHLATQGVPAQLADQLAILLVADIWIEDLYIKSWTDEKGNSQKALKFGVSVDFKEGLNLFGEIKLLNVGIGVSSAPKDYAFPARRTLPTIKPAEDKPLELPPAE